MPLRNFVCKSCGSVTEHLVRLSEPDPTECACGAGGAEGLERDPSPSSTSFKLAGSGWARDGYASDSRRGQ